MTSLEEFGLTRYESKAYLTLLSMGTSDARKLSSQSGLPFGRIYDVLSSLESKGLVEKQASRPKKFLAVRPKLALKKLLNLRTEEMKQLVQRAGKVEDELNILFTKTPAENLFWSVAVGDKTMQSYLEKLAQARKELLTYVEVHPKSMHSKEDEVTEFLKVLSKLVEKEVTVKLLIGCKDITALEKIVPQATSFIGLLDGVQVKAIQTISNPFDVIDEEKVQLKVRNPAKPEEYFASIYVWQKEFATELRKKFNEMWKEAKKFKVEVK